MLMSILNESLNKWEIKNFETGPSVPREALKEQDTDTQIAYEQLRAEAIPNFFTTAFLTASKTNPLYTVVLNLLRAGSTPYEVIEWLTGECNTKDKTISHYRKEDTQY